MYEPADIIMKENNTMNNFVQYTPTRIIFGKDTEKEAGPQIKKEGGSRVFIVYGGGSAVKSGLLDRVTASIAEAGLECQTFGGVKPNPTLDHAEEGRRKAIEFGADYILGVGGGSVIDTAKAIAHGTANPDYAIWDIWYKKTPITRSLPVGAVLTIAAAGSEMSSSAVLTNEETGKKKGFDSELNRCRFAIMNPALLATVPKYHLAAGIADIMMHTMERYFIPGVSCQMTDEIAEGLLRTVVNNGRIVMDDPTNYDAMAEVMWCSSLSHNDITECGRGKDFSVHKFGQALGGLYDSIHGATLTAVWGSWANYLVADAPDRFARYARKVWGVTNEDDLEAGKEGIRRTVAFFKEIGMPVTIKELGVDPTDEEIEKLSLDASYNKTITITRIKPCGYVEIKEIFEGAL